MLHATSHKMAGIAGAAVLGIALSPSVLGSSHNDAPQIEQDPGANLTDVYAFVGTSYDDPGMEVLNVVVNVHPFVEPGNGPHYDRFSEDALYSIHITDPATGEGRARYDFLFSDGDPLTSPGLKNPDTILSYGLGTEVGPISMIGGPTQNLTQTYTVFETIGDGRFEVVGEDLLVAPPNPGARVTPDYNDANGMAVSGATDLASLDPLTAQAIQETSNGAAVFAGPRDDSFFGDVPGIFDLLNPRILGDSFGQDGGGDDGFKGFNVLTYAIQIPMSAVQDFAGDYTSPFFGEQTGVGVYASVSRRRVTVIQGNGNIRGSGPFVQVNRLGNPLFNEVLVPHRDKDTFNRSMPTDDAVFATYAQNPEVAGLINFVFETDFVTEGRADLEAIFIPDVLRVNTMTGPVRLEGDAGFNRLGFIGGDVTDSGVSSGWPNGRRLGDDVIDIALTAVASGPTYDPIVVVGDNVLGNDIAYNGVFPYAATPHSGTNVSQDAGGGDGDDGGEAAARIGGGMNPADVNGDGIVDDMDVSIVIEQLGSISE